MNSYNIKFKIGQYPWEFEPVLKVFKIKNNQDNSTLELYKKTGIALLDCYINNNKRFNNDTVINKTNLSLKLLKLELNFEKKKYDNVNVLDGLINLYENLINRMENTEDLFVYILNNCDNYIIYRNEIDKVKYLYKLLLKILADQNEFKNIIY